MRRRNKEENQGDTDWTGWKMARMKDEPGVQSVARRYAAGASTTSLLLSLSSKSAKILHASKGLTYGLSGGEIYHYGDQGRRGLYTAYFSSAGFHVVDTTCWVKRWDGASR